MHTTYDNALHEIVLITRLLKCNPFIIGINGLLVNSDLKNFKNIVSRFSVHKVKKQVASTHRLISLGISIPKYLAVLVLRKVKAVSYRTCKTFWAF